LTQNVALLAGCNTICWYYSGGGRADFFGPPGT